MDKEAKSALEKIKDWYEKEENKEFVRRSLFTTGGGLTGFIVNRLIGKKGWLADVLATGAGMAGGYGLSLLNDPKITANKAQAVVNRKDEENKEQKEKQKQERRNAADATREAEKRIKYAWLDEIAQRQVDLIPISEQTRMNLQNMDLNDIDAASLVSDEDQRKLDDMKLKESGYVAIIDEKGNTVGYESLSGNDPILDRKSPNVVLDALIRITGDSFWEAIGIDTSLDGKGHAKGKSDLERNWIKFKQGTW